MGKANKPILITGVAGFIGSALAQELIRKRERIIGIDNLNDYYDVNLKKSRLKTLANTAAKNKVAFNFQKVSIENNDQLNLVFEENRPKTVIHLAAQAGVRYSIQNPESYIKSNLVGFANILESCRNYECENLIFASSSSVYGGNELLPYSEDQSVNHPISLYAATKKSNELMAHSYSHLYGIPCTGLRFFTVYGPWGRPDMAPMIFSKAILSGNPIKVFNYGKMKRDFTYIDDVVNAIVLCIGKKAEIDENFNFEKPNPSTSFAPYRILNLGNNKPINLMYFVELLENYLGKKAIINYEKLHAGDVKATYADMQKIEGWINFKTYTSIENGLEKFCNWYKSFYN